MIFLRLAHFSTVSTIAENDRRAMDRRTAKIANCFLPVLPVVDICVRIHAQVSPYTRTHAHMQPMCKLTHIHTLMSTLTLEKKTSAPFMDKESTFLFHFQRTEIYMSQSGILSFRAEFWLSKQFSLHGPFRPSVNLPWFTQIPSDSVFIFDAAKNYYVRSFRFFQ